MDKHKEKKSNKSTPVRPTNLIIALMFLGLGFLFDPLARDPYLGPRMLWLPLMGGVLWGLNFRRISSWSIHRSSSKSFFLLLLAFLLWMGLSSFYAINASESVFYLVRFLLYLGLLVLWMQILRVQPEGSFRMISKISTGLLIILSIVGVSQSTGLAFTSIPGLPHPVGISGNRNIFGAFVALQLPMAAFLLFNGKKSWQWIGGTALVFGAITLLLSQTRSAWLGAGFGYLVANLLFFLKRSHLDKSVRTRLKFLNTGLLGLLFLGLITVFFIAPETTLVKEFKNRVISLLRPNSDSANIATGNIEERLYVWSQTYQMSKDRPFQGVGAGNWRIIFPTYGGGSSKLSDASFMDKIRVRPHNFFLRTLSELGWIGLLLFIGILFMISRMGWLVMKKTSKNIHLLIGIMVITALSMFLFDLLFSFSIERMETSHLIIFYLACLLVLNESGPNATKNKTWSLSKQVCTAIMMPVFLIAAFYGYQRWQYDRNLLKVVNYELQQLPYEMLAVISKTKNPFITIDPVSDPIQLQEARAFIQLKDYSQALRALRKAENYHPNNHRIHNTKAFIHLQGGDLDQANSSLEKAQALSPNYPPMLQNLCLYYFLSRQYSKSMEVFERLQWEGDPVLEKLKEDIQHKIDFGETEDSEIYQAILYVKEQVDKGEKQLDITPLISVYNKMESDSLFIDTYLETIYNGIVYANKQRGMEDRLDEVTARKDKMKSILLSAPNLTAISQRITQNDHFKTSTAMQFSSLNSIRTVDQVLFPIE